MEAALGQRIHPPEPLVIARRVQVISVILCLLLPGALSAQGTSHGTGTVTPYCVSGCGGGGEAYGVIVNDMSTAAAYAHTSGIATNAVIMNTGTQSDTYTMSCQVAQLVSCDSIRPLRLTIAAGHSAPVNAYITTGDSGTTGRVTITASGGASASNTDSVVVTGSPIHIAAPSQVGLPTRFVVHTRQPILRALFRAFTVDTTKTTMTWRGASVTAATRASAGLAEWEVDSAHRLGIGDSAQWVVKVCAQQPAGMCATESHWVVLPADSQPVVDFTGRPLEALGASFATGVGPGLTVSGADISTGFSTVPYVSMGAPRSTGLVYSSRTSYPRALIPVTIELPWPAGTPSQLKIVLFDGAIRLDSTVISNPTCATGATPICRTVLQGDFLSTSFSQPTRKWLTVQTSVTSGTLTKTTTDSTEVVLVDRRTTRYGSGWWPSAYALVAAAGPDRLLVDAAGAATVFRGSGDSVYIAPPGSTASLVKTAGGWELHTRGTTAKVVFDASGRVLKAIDNNGNRDSVAYAGSTDQITALYDPLGKATAFSYDGNGKLATITSLAGTSGARQTAVTIDPATNRLLYDSLSTPTARPATTTYGYQAFGGTGTMILTTRVGVLADTTQVILDSTFRRRPVQARLPAVTDTTGVRVVPVMAYTAAEAQGYHGVRSLDSAYVEVRDALGHWTRSLLNRWGESRSTWDAIGVVSRSGYDADGRLVWSEGKNGDASRVYTAYDPRHRITKTYLVRSTGDTLRLDSLVYDASDRVVRHVNLLGRADSVGYDANGNVSYTRAVNDSVTRWWRRADGLVDSTRAPGSAGATVYAYDPTWHNVLATWFETPAQRDSIIGTDTVHITADTITQDSVLYDGYGRDTLHLAPQRVQVTATSTQWQWRKTRTYLNIANQVDSTVTFRTDNCSGACHTPPAWPANSDTTRTRRVAWRYDRAGRDSVRLNDRGIAESYLYDRLGRVVRTRPWVDSAGVQDSAVYDLAGNVVKAITRNGLVLTTAFDSRNRDTATVIPGVGTLRKAFGGPQDQLTREWYDGYVDSIGGVTPTVALGYDARGRLTVDTTYAGSVPQVTTYGYDTLERPIASTDRNGTWTTRFDPVTGWVDTLLTPFGDTLSVGHDAIGRAVTSAVHGPTPYGLSTALAFASVGDLAARSQTTFGDGVDYTAGLWDALGLTGLTGGGTALAPKWSYSSDPGLPDSPHHAITDTVTYDAWGRVAHWVSYNDGTSNGNEWYAFDRAGNLTAAALTAMTYDAETDRIRTARAGTGPTSTFQFDRAGNLIQRVDTVAGAPVTWVYGYNALNELIAVRRNGLLIARYAYDVTGRRIARRVYSRVSGGTFGYTRYVYHGAQVAYEADSAGTQLWRYVWGPGVDNLVVARDTAGHVLQPVTDRLGSIRGWFNTVTDSVLQATMYTPYGAAELLGTTSPFPLPSYGWTGREYDAETGFYYMRARYYDLTEMRFTQEDPAGAAGGQNHYAYVGGAVLSATDPSGALPVPDKYRWIHAGVAPIHGWDDWGWFTDANWYSYDGTSVLYSERLMFALQAVEDAYRRYQDAFKDVAAAFKDSDENISRNWAHGGVLLMKDVVAEEQELSSDQFRRVWVSTAFGTSVGFAEFIHARLLGGFVGVGLLAPLDAANAGEVAGAATWGIDDYRFTEYSPDAFRQYSGQLPALIAHETWHAFDMTLSEEEVCYHARMELEGSVAGCHEP